MVHGFIEEFVDAYKVIADGFFLECSKVVLEDGSEFYEECGDECYVGVAACDCA
jgi:hypothetical protein